jgi:hypothetical protein
MASGVFVLRDNALVSMASAQFASEADFQQLLAKFPELLSGDQIDPSVPRKWVLVRREKAVPADENGGGRWSLDHLFLDQDGVPTLVEVKRQTDTRIRRKVVGQMLDYAANCVVYWPVEGLQADFEVTCAAQSRSPSEVLSDLLGPEASEGAFWLQVKTNLEAGRIRLLFVADAIPPELRRIIEFLNKQMDPAEVLGLELRQFEGQGLKTIVPLVVGQTQEAVQKRRPSGGSGRVWDEEAVFADLTARRPEPEVVVARQIADWMKSSGGKLWFGSGSQDGSMSVGFTRKDGVQLYPAILWTYGRLELQFKSMKERPFFSDIERRRELMRNLNAIRRVDHRRSDFEEARDTARGPNFEPVTSGETVGSSSVGRATIRGGMTRPATV